MPKTFRLSRKTVVVAVATLCVLFFALRKLASYPSVPSLNHVSTKKQTEARILNAEEPSIPYDFEKKRHSPQIYVDGVEGNESDVLSFEDEIKTRRVSSKEFNGANIEEVLSWLAGEVGNLKSARPQIELEGREASDFEKVTTNLKGLTIEVAIKHLSVVWDLEYEITEQRILFTEKDLSMPNQKQ